MLNFKESQFKVKKYLGQNFLVSKKHLKKITDEIFKNINKTKQIIEVGPGLGALTEEMLFTIRQRNLAIQLIAVEKDSQLSTYLGNKFSRFSNFILKNEDILNFLDKDAHNFNNYKIVGNIPYYISKPLINKCLTLKQPPQEIIFLLQKEVANQLVNPDKNTIFSLSVKLRSTIQKLYTIKKGNFRPIPKVDAALIKIKHIHQPDDFNFIMKLIKIAFSSKRKTLYNNLTKYYSKMITKNVIKSLQFKDSVRAEDLDKNDWLKLYNLLHNETVSH